MEHSGIDALSAELSDVGQIYERHLLDPVAIRREAAAHQPRLPKDVLELELLFRSSD